MPEYIKIGVCVVLLVFIVLLLGETNSLNKQLDYEKFWSNDYRDQLEICGPKLKELGFEIRIKNPEKYIIYPLNN